jgi:hypothetical protein
MKLLLTSAGITNTSIRAALLELLGRPIADCRALLISTASYPLRGGPELAWSFIAGEEPRTPMAELGWEVRRRPRAHGAAQHRSSEVAEVGPGRRRPAGERR